MRTVIFWYVENGVLYTYDSYDDLGLLLSSKTIGAATPKLLTVDIPSGDGELDYTDYFGVINYNNRPLSFNFTDIGDRREFLNKYSRLQNLFNGRKMNVTLSEDAGFHYIGRVIVNEWVSEKNIGKITIDVNAEPYKLKNAPTVIYRTITEETVINCRNLKKTVEAKVEFTTDGANGTISLGGKESSEFERVCEDTVLLVEGDNVLTVKPSSGATLPMGVRIEYQEGSL